MTMQRILSRNTQIELIILTGIEVSLEASMCHDRPLKHRHVRRANKVPTKKRSKMIRTWIAFMLGIPLSGAEQTIGATDHGYLRMLLKGLQTDGKVVR